MTGAALPPAVRTPDSWGTAVSLAGGVAVGWALNAALVAGRADLGDPLPLAALALGVALVYAGVRLRQGFDPAELVSFPEEDDEEGFDEELSPLQEDWLEDRERDDSHER